MSKEKNSKKKEKKNKTGLIIGIVLVLILLSVGGYFLYKYIKFKTPIDEVWGETYYVYLKDSQKDEKKATIPKEAKKEKVKFVKPKKQKDPVMVVTYEIKEEVHTNIYFIEENKVNAYVYEQPTTLELLFNIEKNEYNYYIHSVKDTEESYDSLDKQIENKDSEEENQEPEYTFPKKEDGTLEDYKEKFIEPEIKDDGFIEFDPNGSESALKEKIEESVDEYLPQEEVVTPEVEEDVNKKLEDIKELLEKQKEAKLEEVFNKLQGVWYNEKNNAMLTFSLNEGKKHFASGWFASEGYASGNMEDIKLEDDSYSFYVDDKYINEKVDFEVNITDLDNKTIKLGDTKYIFINKDYNKGYDIIGKKYFGY